MESFIENLRINLNEELKAIQSNNSSILKVCEQSITGIHAAIKQLRQKVVQSPFPSDAHEIQFFKNIKPHFFALLMYYVDTYHLNASLNAWDVSISMEILQSKIHELNAFRTKNINFYQYITSGLDINDERYFLRRHFNFIDAPDFFSYHCDACFITNMDYYVARLKANDMLLVDINQKFQAYQHDTHASHSSIPSEFCLDWSDSKISLAELIYALHAAGCISHGHVEIKDITRFFEHAFKIDMHDIYNDFKQIKHRNHQTKFLDHLKEAILNRIQVKDS
ncbi:RteC protein [Breznakibacter xylanolyticus]|uniref:RteC protein n=1 Tax=Breznakibacter xylanolyticus TaxID=990 RepID=A0A2W7NPM0_9BACT|nr:RteC domain-containing protein [Breznakibacter xylanolyticus]PZX20097.1 RteC protein [Breznakibacter xylanolyticus]